MKLRHFVAIVLAVLWLTVPAAASGEYANFDDLKAAWYQAAGDDARLTGWYPDGVCGIWLEDGITVGITDDARGEAAKAEILDALQWSDNLTFVTQAHTQRELMQIMRTLEAEALGKIEGVYTFALNESADLVEIGVTAAEPSPALRAFMEDCTARFGDAVAFTASEQIGFSYTSGANVGGEPGMEIGADSPIGGLGAPAAPPHSHRMLLLAGGTGALLLAAGAWLLLRRRPAAQTPAGSLPLLRHSAGMLYLLRKTAPAPPAELRERILSAAFSAER